MYFLASSPSSVPSLTLARKMSPVEIFGMPKCEAMNCGLGALAGSWRPDEDEPH